MELTIKKPIVNSNGQIELKEIEISEININQYAMLTIDGSTKNSGLAIVRELDGALMYIIKATRDTNKKDGKEVETPVRYKIRLKNTVRDILLDAHGGRYITRILYEEPVVYHISAVSNLFMLRAFVEEMIIENEPKLDYIKYSEISNMTWKRLLLEPDPVPQGTDKQKEAVKNKLLYYMPYLQGLIQDEYDAYGMGYAASQLLKKHGEDAIEEEMKSKKKARPFEYNIEFIGADEDEEAFEEIMDIYSGPERILDNGIEFDRINKTTKFTNFVYDMMGNEDRLLIIRFNSDSHGDLILKHKIGHLSAQFKYIYALVWRKTRKIN